MPDPLLEAQPTIPVRTLSRRDRPAGRRRLYDGARRHPHERARRARVLPVSRLRRDRPHREENDVTADQPSFDLASPRERSCARGRQVHDRRPAERQRRQGQQRGLRAASSSTPGDVVELGHVKLRFVGPFEHYVFDPNIKHDARPFPAKIVVGQLVARRRPGHCGLRRGAQLARAGAQHRRPARAPITAAPAPSTPPRGAAPGADALRRRRARRPATPGLRAGARAALDQIGAAERRPPRSTSRSPSSPSRSTPSAAELHAAAVRAARRGRDGEEVRRRPRPLRLRSRPAASTRAWARRAPTRRARCWSRSACADAERARAAGNAAPQVREAADEEIERLDPGRTRCPGGARARMRARQARARRGAPRSRASGRRGGARGARRRRGRRSSRGAHRGGGGGRAGRCRSAHEAGARSLAAPAVRVGHREISRKALKAEAGHVGDAYQIIAVCSCSLAGDVEGGDAGLHEARRGRNCNLVRSLQPVAAP